MYWVSIIASSAIFPSIPFQSVVSTLLSNQNSSLPIDRPHPSCCSSLIFRPPFSSLQIDPSSVLHVCRPLPELLINPPASLSVVSSLPLNHRPDPIPAQSKKHKKTTKRSVKLDQSTVRASLHAVVLHASKLQPATQTANTINKKYKNRVHFKSWRFFLFVSSDRFHFMYSL